MKWDVTEVKIIGKHTIRVQFEDGTEGSVKFQPTFFRGVFSHLQEDKYFEEVRIEEGVVTWPGELDLAPDAMHTEIQAKGEWLVVNMMGKNRF